MQQDKDSLSKTILSERNKYAEEKKNLELRFQDEYERFSAKKDMELENKNLEIQRQVNIW